MLRFVPILLSLALQGFAADFVAGRSHFGTDKFIEYIPGDLPLVIAAPHGGREEPESIPSRTKGVVQSDTNTQELARSIASEFTARTGHHAHLVICRLHRKKLDCNREIEEAAGGNPVAERAWKEYHGFVDTALETASKTHGKVFFIDLHGQNHPDRRIELGYLHSQELLGRSDSVLTQAASRGSLRRMLRTSKLGYPELLRGEKSLGGLLEARGFPCTPSPSRPVPNVPYFQGGYTTRRAVGNDLPVAGLQIETNLVGLRDSAARRKQFATALVEVLQEYLPEQYGLRLTAAKSARR